MKTRYATIALLLAFTAIIIRFISYDTYNNPEKGLQAIANIPMQIGEWQGQDIQLDESVYKILETRSIIHRSYSKQSGEKVFLSIVYYTETKVDFHAPESCLAGQGKQITKNDKIITIRKLGQITQIPINQLVRSDEGRDSLIYYFYKAGKFIGRDYIKLRLNLALNKLSSDAKSGSLIRISTPVISGQQNKEMSAEVMQNFLEELYPYIMQL